MTPRPGPPSVFRNTSPEAALLDMVWRIAPRFMRAGGGVLEGENPSPAAPIVLLTPRQRARICALASAGNHTATEIAAAVHASPGTVRKFCVRRGYALPDGRRR